MIVGIGTDIVEIKRVRDAVGKWGERFLKKIFTESEISYCYKKKDPFPHLAVRFAAKEAVIKALSNSAHEAQSAERGLKFANLKNIEVLNQPTGKPFINLLGSLKASFHEMLVIHLTLTHERSYAIAMVVLERKNS